MKVFGKKKKTQFVKCIICNKDVTHNSYDFYDASLCDLHRVESRIELVDWIRRERWQHEKNISSQEAEQKELERLK